MKVGEPIKEKISYADHEEQIERQATQEDVDEWLERQKQQEKQDRENTIHIRLEEIDKEVSQARVIADMLAGNPPHQRVLDLLSERESLLEELESL